MRVAGAHRLPCQQRTMRGVPTAACCSKCQGDCKYGQQVAAATPVRRARNCMPHSCSLPQVSVQSIAAANTPQRVCLGAVCISCPSLAALPVFLASMLAQRLSLAVNNGQRLNLLKAPCSSHRIFRQRLTPECTRQAINLSVMGIAEGGSMLMLGRCDRCLGNIVSRWL